MWECIWDEQWIFMYRVVAVCQCLIVFSVCIIYGGFIVMSMLICSQTDHPAPQSLLSESTAPLHPPTPPQAGRLNTQPLLISWRSYSVAALYNSRRAPGSATPPFFLSREQCGISTFFEKQCLKCSSHPIFIFPDSSRTQKEITVISKLLWLK